MVGTMFPITVSEDENKDPRSEKKPGVKKGRRGELRADSLYGVTWAMNVFQFAFTVLGKLPMYSFPSQMFPELSETAAE